MLSQIRFSLFPLYKSPLSLFHPRPFSISSRKPNLFSRPLLSSSLHLLAKNKLAATVCRPFCSAGRYHPSAADDDLAREADERRMERECRVQKHLIQNLSRPSTTSSGARGYQLALSPSGFCPTPSTGRAS